MVGCWKFSPKSDQAISATSVIAERNAAKDISFRMPRRASRAAFSRLAPWMMRIEAEAAAQGLQGVKLTAQESAVSFYLRLGYELFGEPFMDAGIPHRWMKKALGPEAHESQG